RTFLFFFEKKHKKEKKEMHIIIVGGGPSGLYAAMFLQKVECVVSILEKKKEMGGKAKTMHVGNSIWELGPSVFHTNQPNIMYIIKKLGISFRPVNKCPNEHLKNLPTIQDHQLKVRDVLNIETLRNGNEIADMNYCDW